MRVRMHNIGREAAEKSIVGPMFPQSQRHTRENPLHLTVPYAKVLPSFSMKIKPLTPPSLTENFM